MFIRKAKILVADTDEGRAAQVEISCLGLRPHIRQIRFYKAPAEIKDLALGDYYNILVISAKDIFNRNFKLTNKEILKDKIKLNNWLEKQNLPFKLDACYFDSFLIDDCLNFIAVRKELLKQRTDDFIPHGLNLKSVAASFIALYNLIIFNYPEEKNKFCLLNIKNNYSEVIICEAGRLWLYALSSSAARVESQTGDFAYEVLRTLDSHNIQNPAFKANLKDIYVTGKINNKTTKDLSAIIKLECRTFDPFKKLARPYPAGLNQEIIYSSQSAQDQSAFSDVNLAACALGTSLPLLFPRGSFIAGNLIREKIRGEFQEAQRSIFKKGSFILLLAAVFLFSSANAASWLIFNKSYVKIARAQILLDKVLPQARFLRQDIDSLKELNLMLKAKLLQHQVWLSIFAGLAQAKPGAVLLNEVDAKKEDSLFSVNVSARAKSYDEINAFLNTLKEKGGLDNIKVVSTSGSALGVPEEIDFKMRLEKGRQTSAGNRTITIEKK